MPATIVDAEGGGGHPGAGQSDMTTSWSLTAGNQVLIAEMTRARSGAPSFSPTISDITDVAQTSSDFNDVTAHLFVGTVDTTGALTYTPSQTSADRWTAVIVEILDGTFLDAGGTHEGPFDADISLVCDAMTGDGGVVVFTVNSNADGTIDITAPTALFENAPTGFMLSNAAAAEALDDTDTSTLTGAITGGGVNIHHQFWALFSGSGGGSPTEPDVITDLVLDPHEDSIDLAWSAPDDNGEVITDYVIQWAPDSSGSPGSWTTISDGTSTAISYTHTGLSTFTVYWYRIAAVNAIGQGAYSNPISAMTWTWVFETDLSDPSEYSVHRWHKQSGTFTCTTGRPVHINNVDDVNGDDDVLPPNDVVWDTDRLWIGAGAQNYGGSEIRFNNRINLSGPGPHIIEFSVVLDPTNALNGWPELVITDKPYAGAAWSSNDNAAESTPRFGFIARLNASQYVEGGLFYPKALLSVWDEWVQTNYDPDGGGAVFTTGVMHDIRIEFDDTEIIATVDGDPWWSDIWTLPSELLDEVWVHIGVHNHATLKYSPYPDGVVSQWGHVRWGGSPTVPATTHRVPDDFVSHTVAVHSPPGTGTDGGSGPGVDMGWELPSPVLVVSNVPASVDSAMIAFSFQTSLFADPATTTVTYELNGNGGHTVTGLDAMMPADGDGRNYFICEDVVVSELVTGVNEIEITASAPGGGAAPFVSNVELILFEGAFVPPTNKFFQFL